MIHYKIEYMKKTKYSKKAIVMLILSQTSFRSENLFLTDK